MRSVLFLASVVVLSLLSRVAAAETVSFFSVELPVDELNALSAQQVKVRLGGASFLVSQKESGRKVATLYLTTPDLLKNLPPATARSLVTKLADEAEWSLLESAFHTLLASNVDPGSLKEILNVLSSKEGVKAVVERTIESLPQKAATEAACSLFPFLNSATRKGMAERAHEAVSRLQFKCAGFLEREARKLLEEGKPKDALTYLETVTTLFPGGSSDLQSVIGAKNRLSRLVESVDSKDVTGTARAAKALEEDAWLKPHVSKLTAELLYTSAKDALASAKPGSALRLLSGLDFNQRSVREHQLVSAALEKLDISELDAVVVPQVSSMLRSFSLKDEEIKSAYAAALHRVLGHIIEKGDLSALNAPFEQLLAIRPDPSVENDAIRISAARRYVENGNVVFARIRTEEIRTGVPLSLRLRLFHSEGGVAHLILVLAIVIVTPCIILLIIKKRPSVKRVRVEEEDEEVDQQLPPRRFVVYSHGVRAALKHDEYAECLRAFGLQRGATLKKIKVAYRNAVKTCHPDLNPNAGAEESTRFIQLTKTYERLLELHAQQTGER